MTNKHNNGFPNNLIYYQQKLAAKALLIKLETRKQDYNAQV